MATFLFLGDDDERQQLKEILDRKNIDYRELSSEEIRQRAQAAVEFQDTHFVMDAIEQAVNPKLAIRYKGVTTKVLPNDILYIEKTHPDKVTIYLCDGREFHMVATLKELIRGLPSQFMIVHAKYIANLHNVIAHQSIKNNQSELVMQGGRRVPVSHRKRVEVISKLIGGPANR